MSNNRETCPRCRTMVSSPDGTFDFRGLGPNDLVDVVRPVVRSLRFASNPLEAAQKARAAAELATQERLPEVAETDPVLSSALSSLRWDGLSTDQKIEMLKLLVATLVAFITLYSACGRAPTTTEVNVHLRGDSPAIVAETAPAEPELPVVDPEEDGDADGDEIAPDDDSEADKEEDDQDS